MEITTGTIELDGRPLISTRCQRSARPSLASDEKHYRYWRGDVRSLHIFIDQSSVEIFNQRRRRSDELPLLPACSGQLMFSGITPDAFCYWPLRTMVE